MEKSWYLWFLEVFGKLTFVVFFFLKLLNTQFGKRRILNLKNIFFFKKIVLISHRQDQTISIRAGRTILTFHPTSNQYDDGWQVGITFCLILNDIGWKKLLDMLDKV